VSNNVPIIRLLA